MTAQAASEGKENSSSVVPPQFLSTIALTDHFFDYLSLRLRWLRGPVSLNIDEDRLDTRGDSRDVRPTVPFESRP